VLLLTFDVLSLRSHPVLSLLSSWSLCRKEVMGSVAGGPDFVSLWRTGKGVILVGAGGDYPRRCPGPRERERTRERACMASKQRILDPSLGVPHFQTYGHFTLGLQNDSNLSDRLMTSHLWALGAAVRLFHRAPVHLCAPSFVCNPKLPTFNSHASYFKYICTCS